MTDLPDDLRTLDDLHQNGFVAEQRHLPISVVIVSYNARELLRTCLASTASEPAQDTVVIDNASSDGSDRMVTEEFPSVRLIRSENIGYGAAANLAIAACSSKYILLLNSDTVLHPGTLQALCDYLDGHPQAAIVGPLLVYPNGNRQDSCFAFPTPLEILLRETSLSRIGAVVLSKVSSPESQAVPWVLGAALAIRRSAFDSVGGFDPSFFMYFEEVDLCYRLHRSGWQTHFTPTATLTHLGGGSTGQGRPAMVIQLYKSLCLFYQMHYSRFQAVQLRLVLTYLMIRNLIKTLLQKKKSMHFGPEDSSSDDLDVFRTILYGVWSRQGWLKTS